MHAVELASINNRYYAACIGVRESQQGNLNAA